MKYHFLRFQSRAARWYQTTVTRSQRLQILENAELDSSPPNYSSHKLRHDIYPESNHSQSTAEPFNIIEHLLDTNPLLSSSGPIEARYSAASGLHRMCQSAVIEQRPH